MRPAFFALILPILGACTEFPSLDRAVDPAVFDTDYPALVPLETVTGTGPAPRTTPADQAALAARAAALTARANRLGRTVIASEDRDRMDAGVTRPGALQAAQGAED